MNNQKGFANIVLIGIIVILVCAVGYFAFVKKSITPTDETQSTNNLPSQQNPLLSTTQTPPSSAQTNNPGWEKYSGTSFVFEYPSLISVKQEGETVTLNHSVAYKHPDPCDFKGDPRTPLKEMISDFGISLMVFNKNLKDSIQSNESDYVAKSFDENGALIASTETTGFISKFSAGSLDGFEIVKGVEGCGVYTYYFPISFSKTLFVKRPFVSELTPVGTGQYQTYLNLPGIISPIKEKEFFVKILSSLKVES